MIELIMNDATVLNGPDSYQIVAVEAQQKLNRQTKLLLIFKILKLNNSLPFSFQLSPFLLPLRAETPALKRNDNT